MAWDDEFVVKELLDIEIFEIFGCCGGERAFRGVARGKILKHAYSCLDDKVVEIKFHH